MTKRFSGALMVDDKMELLHSNSIVQGSKEFPEYKNLRTVQNFFLFNNIPLYTLPNISDYPAEALDRIKSLPTVDLLILDLDYNANGSFDAYDQTILSRLLMEAKETFKSFMVVIYSSISDLWEEIKPQIIEDNEVLREILSVENVRLIKKDGSETAEKLLESINNEVSLHKVAANIIRIDSEIATSKYWIREWILLGLFVLAFFTVISLLFIVKMLILVIACYLTILIIFGKLVLTENITLEKLKSLKRSLTLNQ